jgi:hypothetical protein
MGTGPEAMIDELTEALTRARVRWVRSDGHVPGVTVVNLSGHEFVVRLQGSGFDVVALGSQATLQRCESVTDVLVAVGAKPRGPAIPRGAS